MPEAVQTDCAIYGCEQPADRNPGPFTFELFEVNQPKMVLVVDLCHEHGIRLGRLWKNVLYPRIMGGPTL
jgi:hypothetical protein